MVALPYTPGRDSLLKSRKRSLARSEGLPVVLCTVHSQVAPVCAGLEGVASRTSGRRWRVAGVALGHGSVPTRPRPPRACVAVAPCLDGDAQFVSAAAAFAWAKAQGYDAVVCSVGPGIVGTGSRLGHGALALADAANAATALGGRPVLAVRTSEADPRERHHGVSHHADAVLELALGDVHLPAEQDGAGWEEACAGLPLSHMGRGREEDPVFFRAAYAAGVVAPRMRG